MTNPAVYVWEALRDFLFPPGRRAEQLEKMAASGELESLEQARGLDEGWIYPVLGYRDPLVRELVWQIKYRRNGKLIGAAGNLMREMSVGVLGELEGMVKFDRPVLVPIPLSKKRAQERGYNQAEMLARAIVEAGSARIFEINTGVLVKIKDTPAQTTLRRGQRLKNLKGCFAVVDKNAVAGRNIILVDDVTTTGATLKEARKTLKATGAKRILAVTLAH
jgi:ComF family protein